MRRLILEEPFSAAAIWGRALAAFALALAAIAILLARSGAVEATGALSVLGAAIICACLALLLAGAGAIVVWQSGRRGLGAIVAGVFAATLVLVYPAWLAAQALRLPLLNDVSTDLNDPPDFSRAGKAAAARGGVDHPSISPEVRDLQRRAYKDVQPILLDLDIDEAWPLVQKAVAARKWRVVDEVRPGGRVGVGHLDAIDKTPLMGFPEDVTVRVRPLAGQTRIDVRSASRFGRHDFGSNAARIARFSTELQAQLDER